MRLTAEEYERRTENRVTGKYVVRPPNTERRGRKKVEPHCENCGRKTEYLFDGVVVNKATRYDAMTKEPLGIVDVERDGKVCQRCLGPDDWELDELFRKARAGSKATGHAA